jgi:hypothetical protein
MCLIGIDFCEIESQIMNIYIPFYSTSDESRLPPEFKHIIKGRKRKQQ